MSGLWDDLRYGMRSLWRNRAGSLAVVLILALSVSAATTTFSGFSAMTLRSLPFERAEQLVFIGENWGARWSQMLSYGTYLAWKRENAVFQGMAAHANGLSILVANDAPRRLRTNRISSGFFSTLGVRVRGREFLEDEDAYGETSAVMISEELASELFRDDANALGKTVGVDGVPQQVVGVVPAGFTILQGGRIDLYTPVGRTTTEDIGCNLACGNVYAVARLRPGVTRQQASTQLETIRRRIPGADIPPNEKYGVAVRGLLEANYHWERRTLGFVLLAALLLMVLACVSASNLMLLQSHARAGETAVRLAIGAAPLRIVRSMLVQGLLLGSAAGILGLLGGFIGCRLAASFVPDPRWLPMGGAWAPDLGVAAFGCAISLLSGMMTVVPAGLGVMRARTTDGLRRGGGVKSGSPRAIRWSKWLVGGHIALATLISIETASVIASARRSLYGMRGIDVERVLTVRVERTGKPAADDEAIALERGLLEKLSAVPGVASVASTEEFPTIENPGLSRASLPGAAGRARFRVSIHRVSEGYLETTGIPLLRGSWLRGAAGDGVVVNRTLVEQYSNGAGALGQMLVLHGRRGEGDRSLQIIGIVGDTWSLPRVHAAVPEVYLPTDHKLGGYALLVKTKTSEALRVVDDVRRMVRRTDPQLAVEIVPFADRIVTAGAEIRSLAILLGGLGAFVLLLLVAGVYSSVSAVVASSTRDIGVRMALGGHGRQVWDFLARAWLGVTTIGLALGLAAGYALAPTVRALLETVDSRDWLTYLLVSSVVLVGTIAGARTPIRRALKTSPAVLLITE